MAKKRVLRPGLAPAARQDVRAVLKWSEEKFGKTAAARYRALIKQAVRDVGADPERPGSKERLEIMIDGVRTCHLQFRRSRVSGPGVKEPRHFLLYRRRADGVVEVARILHDGRYLLLPYPANYPSLNARVDPLYPYYGTNNVFIPLKEGTVQRIVWGGLNPLINQPVLSTYLWNCDASPFKSIQITERARLRIQFDFFNVFKAAGNSPAAWRGGDCGDEHECEPEQAARDATVGAP